MDSCVRKIRKSDTKRVQYRHRLSSMLLLFDGVEATVLVIHLCQKICPRPELCNVAFWLIALLPVRFFTQPTSLRHAHVSLKIILTYSARSIFQQVQEENFTFKYSSTLTPTLASNRRCRSRTLTIASTDFRTLKLKNEAARPPP